MRATVPDVLPRLPGHRSVHQQRLCHRPQRGGQDLRRKDGYALVRDPALAQGHEHRGLVGQLHALRRPKRADHERGRWSGADPGYPHHRPMLHRLAWHARRHNGARRRCAPAHPAVDRHALRYRHWSHQDPGQVGQNGGLQARQIPADLGHVCNLEALPNPAATRC